MELFNKLIDKVKTFPQLINEGIKETVQQNAEMIKDYQREQLYSGQDNQGSIITPAYTPLVVSIKQRKGQPFDRVTWKDTGELYRTLQLTAREYDFIIDTHISYSYYLFKKYGDVLGIQQGNLEILTNDFIVPYLKTKLNDELTKP